MSSWIVPVPVALGLSVVPPVVVTVTSNVSSDSAITSSWIGVRSRIEVVPAAMVVEVSGVQTVPSKTSSSLGPGIPKSTPSPIAVIGIVVIPKVMSSKVGLLSSTVNSAWVSTPSVTTTSVIEITGVSSSMIFVVTELFVEEIRVASNEPPVTELIVTTKFSIGSPSVSSIVGIVNVAVVDPAGMVTDPTPV